MQVPSKSYVICCTPRSGSHFFADGLISTGIAGRPRESFPRPDEIAADNAVARDALLTQSPPESSYDAALDAAYIGKVLELGMTPNGIFGTVIHWFQLNDAVRRIHAYLQSGNLTPYEALSRSFPNLSYIWLRRHDKIAQAVSWYKAIETGQYVKLQGGATDHKQKASLEFNYDRIKTYWSALRSFDNGWRFFFEANKINPLTIYYEDVCKDYSGSVVTALEFLKLSPPNGFNPKSQFLKIANNESRQWAEKFRMLQSRA
jgi:LPS sulfotransferase NodH